MTRADFLANKKTNIEARGNVYNAQQWGDHFDRMDANRDGLLTAQEQADFDAAKQTDGCGEDASTQTTRTRQDAGR